MRPFTKSSIRMLRSADLRKVQASITKILRKRHRQRETRRIRRRHPQVSQAEPDLAAELMRARDAAAFEARVSPSLLSVIEAVGAELHWTIGRNTRSPPRPHPSLSGSSGSASQQCEPTGPHPRPGSMPPSRAQSLTLVALAALALAQVARA